MKRITIICISFIFLFLILSPASVEAALEKITFEEPIEIPYSYMSTNRLDNAIKRKISLQAVTDYMTEKCVDMSDSLTRATVKRNITSRRSKFVKDIIFDPPIRENNNWVTENVSLWLAVRSLNDAIKHRDIKIGKRCESNIQSVYVIQYAWSDEKGTIAELLFNANVDMVRLQTMMRTAVRDELNRGGIGIIYHENIDEFDEFKVTCLDRSKRNCKDSARHYLFGYYFKSISEWSKDNFSGIMDKPGKLINKIIKMAAIETNENNNSTLVVYYKLETLIEHDDQITAVVKIASQDGIQNQGIQLTEGRAFANYHSNSINARQEAIFKVIERATKKAASGLTNNIINLGKKIK
ncbi:MAG: hypothetical protein HQL71_14305 [Magnetococcales bacterium]|nr:hypothetical protein [Magnetococcales bacterium]